MAAAVYAVSERSIRSSRPAAACACCHQVPDLLADPSSLLELFCQIAQRGRWVTVLQTLNPELQTAAYNASQRHTMSNIDGQRTRKLSICLFQSVNSNCSSSLQGISLPPSHLCYVPPISSTGNCHK